MVVRVGGVQIGEANVVPGFTDYAFSLTAAGGPQEVRVTFDNDFYNPPFQDRNLFLDTVSVDCTIMP
jgi:hypothetical protein